MKIILLALALAQDAGGRIDWKAKGSENFDAAVKQASKDAKPILLYFAIDGNKDCAALDRGPFSDSRVVSASEALACIYVDCGDGKKNASMSKHFSIQKFPALIFCDATGKEIAPMDARDVDGILKAMKAVTAKFKDVPKPIARPAFPEDIVAAALKAQKDKKLFGIYIYDESPASLSVDAAFLDDALKPLLDRIVFSQSPYLKGTDLSKRFNIDRAPMVLVLDVNLPKPEEKPLARIHGSRNARELRRDLEEALAAAGQAGGLPPDVSPAPKVDLKQEVLSDDEVDRRFIRARIAVALDFIKQGKKDKAIAVLDDVIQSFPKHVETLEAKKLIAEAKK